MCGLAEFNIKYFIAKVERLRGCKCVLAIKREMEVTRGKGK